MAMSAFGVPHAEISKKSVGDVKGAAPSKKVAKPFEKTIANQANKGPNAMKWLRRGTRV